MINFPFERFGVNIVICVAVSKSQGGANVTLKFRTVFSKIVKYSDQFPCDRKIQLRGEISRERTHSQQMCRQVLWRLVA